MARGPSGWNAVSLSLLLLVGAASYATWKLFPVYFTAWQVDHLLADGAARSYPISRVGDPVERARLKEQLLVQLRRQVVDLGITDPQMSLGLNFDRDRADLHCDYRAVVIHPLVDRYTVLLMHRTASASLAPPRY